MRRSLDVLGVEEHRFLEGPVDVDMQTPLDAAGAPQVLEIMREVQPDTVLTFGPDGMTGHEGHKSVSSWVDAAFAEGAKPGARLYHATATPEWAETWLPQARAVQHLPARHAPRSYRAKRSGSTSHCPRTCST